MSKLEKVRRRKGSKGPKLPKAKRVYWTERRCRDEARKYEYLGDFRKYSRVAYNTARRNGWCDGYDWLKRRHRVMSDELVMEEARKYGSRSELRRSDPQIYKEIRKRGLIDKVDWVLVYDEGMKKFASGMLTKIFRLLLEVGVTATREWLFVESGKEDVYSAGQRYLLRSWSGRVTENWAAYKKYRWWLYEDMDYRKGRKPDDDGLHIKP